MRPLLFCALLAMAGCQQQAHHAAVDPALVAELSAAIRAELPQVEPVVSDGPWVEEQATMLAMAALHEPQRIALIRSGKAEETLIKRESGLIIRSIETKAGKPQAPGMLIHLHNGNNLNPEQLLLLYTLTILAKEEVSSAKIVNEIPSR